MIERFEQGKRERSQEQARASVSRPMPTGTLRSARIARRERSIDFRAAVGVITDGAPDSEVLQIGAADGRVLVSRDCHNNAGPSCSIRCGARG